MLGTVLAFHVLEVCISWLVQRKNAQDECDECGDECPKREAKKSLLPESVAWLNLGAEVLHNFIDGIALGVAFSVSKSLGLTTAIAIAAHELPQELADFVVRAVCLPSSIPCNQQLLNVRYF